MRDRPSDRIRAAELPGDFMTKVSLSQAWDETKMSARTRWPVVPCRRAGAVRPSGLILDVSLPGTKWERACRIGRMDRRGPDRLPGFARGTARGDSPGYRPARRGGRGDRPWRKAAPRLSRCRARLDRAAVPGRSSSLYLSRIGGRSQRNSRSVHRRRRRDYRSLACADSPDGGWGIRRCSSDAFLGGSERRECRAVRDPAPQLGAVAGQLVAVCSSSSCCSLSARCASYLRWTASPGCSCARSSRMQGRGPSEACSFRSSAS